MTSQFTDLNQLKLLAHSLEKIREGIVITDMENNILYINEAFLDIYGYKKDEVIGRNVSFLRPPEIEREKKYNSILKQTKIDGWEGEVENLKKDGTKIILYLRTSLVKDEKDNPIALVGAFEDISDRKYFENELIKARERAEKANRLKSEFLAQISHEIRTPVNSILNFLELVKDDIHDGYTDSLDDSFDIIKSSGKRLIRTIDLLVNVAELQTGHTEMLPEKLNLETDIFKKLLREFSELAHVKELEISLECKSNNPCIYADVYSVNQIFSNLLDNAVKYTMEGRIDIRVIDFSENQINVEIEDTGIGISKEYLPFLFNPFSQEETGYSRRFDGSGLGLSLVKSLVDLNNGKIDVKTQKGVGTKFTVSFNKDIQH